MKKLIAALLVTVSAAAASAAPVTFNLSWAGIGNSASATGQVTLDSGLFDGPQHYPATADAFSITVTQSNGTTATWGLNSTFEAVVYAIHPLDLSQQLFGQNVGYSWGSDGCGDFNIFLNNRDGSAAFGVSQFVLQSGNENLRLTSMVAAVPEPAMLGLFGLGAIGLGLSRRRKA